MSRIAACLSSRFLVPRRPVHLSAPWNAVKKPEEAEQIFLQADVNTCLRKLVGFDPAVVFKRRPVHHLSTPRYVLMTDSELKISLDRVNRRGRKVLELVPYLAPHPHEEEVDVLSKDPEIQGYEKCPVIFTDISPGANDRTRLIVVREPNGLLRRANREERSRMNEIFYPTEGRSHVTPAMFREEHLIPVLNRGEYIFVLDRACVQFQPDDPEFHRVTTTTYDHMNEHKAFDVLRSNRYFGSLCFHLVINENMDEMMRFFMENERIQEAALLVQLYYNVHTENRDNFKRQDEDPMKQIRVSLPFH